MNGNTKLIAGGLLVLAMAGTGLAAIPSSVIDVKTGSNYSAGGGGGTLSASTKTAVFFLDGVHNWTSNNVYKLWGVILVRDGATLNIQPGTIIRGVNPIRTGDQYRPGMVIVMRGGKIYANGTASAPICMTDEWDNNFPWFGSAGSSVAQADWYYFNGVPSRILQTGQSYDYGKLGDLHGVWGGLVLCGKAFVNWDGNTTLGSGEISVEGIDDDLGVKGGGTDDNDSSGEVSYLQIRYGGYVLKSTKEINGMTFYGVGRSTKVHHIEVYNNIDDAFEWFGGTVNAKYLVAWGTGDDIFDSDCGFRGKNQFLFGVQRDMNGSGIESGVSDKGMEIDGFEGGSSGGDTSGAGYLYPCSLWANVTLVGIQYTSGKNSTATSTHYNRNVAFSMRDNASPRIYNSIAMDFGAEATLIENRTGSDLTPDLNVATRFTKVPATANYPSVTYNGGATAGLDSTAVAGYLYGDGAMADDAQAAIRGTLFFNCPQGLAYTASTGGSGSGFASHFNWVGPLYGKGPWVSTGAYSYGGFTNWYNFNMDYSGLSTAEYMPVKSRLRYQRTSSSSMTSYVVTNIDPRASNDAVYSAVSVPDQWITPVRFVGAFSPSNNWAKGWTTIDALGALASAPSGDVTSGGSVSAPLSGTTTYVTNTVTTTTYVTNTVTQVVTNGVNGIVYQGDASLITSGTSITASALTTSPVVTYSITSAGTYQLQYTASLSPANWTAVKTFTVATASAGSPVTVNLTDIIGSTPEHSGDSAFYRLIKQ